MSCYLLNLSQLILSSRHLCEGRIQGAFIYVCIPVSGGVFSHGSTQWQFVEWIMNEWMSYIRFLYLKWVWPHTMTGMQSLSCLFIQAFPLHCGSLQSPSTMWYPKVDYVISPRYITLSFINSPFAEWPALLWCSFIISIMDGFSVFCHFFKTCVFYFLLTDGPLSRHCVVSQGTASGQWRALCRVSGSWVWGQNKGQIVTGTSTEQTQKHPWRLETGRVHFQGSLRRQAWGLEGRI